MKPFHPADVAILRAVADAHVGEEIRVQYMSHEALALGTISVPPTLDAWLNQIAEQVEARVPKAPEAKQRIHIKMWADMFQGPPLLVTFVNIPGRAACVERRPITGRLLIGLSLQMAHELQAYLQWERGLESTLEHLAECVHTHELHFDVVCSPVDKPGMQYGLVIGGQISEVERSHVITLRPKPIESLDPGDRSPA